MQSHFAGSESEDRDNKKQWTWTNKHDKKRTERWGKIIEQ